MNPFIDRIDPDSLDYSRGVKIVKTGDGRLHFRPKITMRQRCEDQGHEWENCCSVVFEIYQKCKWCGEIKR